MAPTLLSRSLSRRLGMAVSILGVVAAISWGAVVWTRSAELSTVDHTLTDRLGSATGAVAATVNAARTRALVLATSTAVQVALADTDRAALARAIPPGVVITRRGLVLAGSLLPNAVPVRVQVAARGGIIGSVVVSATVPHGDFPIILTRDGSIVSGPGRGQHVHLPEGRAIELLLGRTRYRVLGVHLSGQPESWLVASALPTRAIDRAVASRRYRAAGGAILAILAGIGAAFLLRGRFRRRRRGRPQARANAVTLVGDALAATHERSALLPVILRVLVEASGAAGGRLLESGLLVHAIGEPPSRGKTHALRIELGSNDIVRVSVELYPPESGFTAESRAEVRSLSTQARIALENAHLHQVVEQQAATDDLTQLPNRRRFMEALQSERLRSERFGSPLAVVLADLDNFKRINDAFGHQAGDRILVAFADVVREQLREVDLPARLGGEEFAILLPETDLPGAVALAERVRIRLEHVSLDNDGQQALSVTASFGVAAYPISGAGSELLALSDVALYRAKTMGKNKVVALVPP